MRATTSIGVAVLAMVMTLAFGSFAQATSVRTFVASFGNDANAGTNCPRSAPCRNFSTAFGVTTAGGEIVALDAAGYGTIVINKSITIVSTAGAFIAVPSGGTGIAIVAGVNDVITIDGLILDGDGVGQDGISFITGRSLTIKNSVIRSLTNVGIYYQPNASGNLSVSNTVVVNTSTGVFIYPSGSGIVTANFSRVELYHGAQGVMVGGTNCTCTITAVVADSVVADTTTRGLATETISATTRLMVIRSVVANNATGLSASGATATLRVGQSTLTGNSVTWTALNSATLRSYQDNNIDGNLDGDPAPTTIAKK